MDPIDFKGKSMAPTNLILPDIQIFLYYLITTINNSRMDSSAELQ